MCYFCTAQNFNLNLRGEKDCLIWYAMWLDHWQENTEATTVQVLWCCSTELRLCWKGVSLALRTISLTLSWCANHGSSIITVWWKEIIVCDWSQPRALSAWVACSALVSQPINRLSYCMCVQGLSTSDTVRQSFDIYVKTWATFEKRFCAVLVQNRSQE